MREAPGSANGKQAFDLVSLSRYFSELSPQPMVAVEGTKHIVRHLNVAISRLVGREAMNLVRERAAARL